MPDDLGSTPQRSRKAKKNNLPKKFRAWSNPIKAETIKWSHPTLVSRYMFSERVTPAMAMMAVLAPMVRTNQRPVDDDNRFRKAERTGTNWVATSLHRIREAGDVRAEQAFGWLYDWPGIAVTTPDQGRKK